MTEDLAQRLHQRHPHLFRDRAKRYGPILDDVLERLDRQGELTNKDLTDLKGAHCGSDRRPDRRKLRHLIRVLKTINAEGSYQVPLPTTPVPAARPTLLPTSFQQWARLPTAEAQLAFLKTTEEGTGDVPWDPCLGLAMRLIAHLGLGKRVAEGVLTHARASALDPAGYLWTPVHPEDPHGAYYRLPLPASLFAGFQAWLAMEPTTSDASESQPGTAANQDTVPNKGLEHTRNRLEAAFQSLNAQFESAQGAAEKGRRIASWSRFGHDGRYLALRLGVPGVFLEAVRDYPLPAEVTDFEPPEASGQRLDRPAGKAAPIPTLEESAADRPAGPVTLFEGEPPEDWSRQVRNALRAFADRADELARNGVIKRGQQETALRDYLEGQLQRANAMAPGTSILHLALLWGFAQLIADKAPSKKRIKVSTLRTYFNRVFSPTLLSAPETWDLAEWDDETVEEVTTRVLATKNWSPASRQYFRETWANFLRFAQSYPNVLTEVTIVAGQRTDLPGRPRNAIFKPAEIDRLFSYLHRPNLRSAHIQACALTLGAYGGLRASEVLGLTLGDVVVTDQECWVGIRAGKTPAARRRIPLHLVAPPDQTAALRNWVGKRQAEFAKLGRPDQVALFGPYQHEERYSRAGLIDPLVQWLRQQTGAGVDFHLLRHTAASWLFARWYAAACGDQGGESSLPHGWAFSPEGLQRAYQFLQGSLTDSLDEGADAFLRLAKFMGHQGHDTLIRHYLHTLGWLHGRALSQVEGSLV